MRLKENKPSYFSRILAGKNIYIFVMVAIAFAFLNVYRLNSPLKVGSIAPEMKLTASNGESFVMNEILSPKVIIFYKKHTYFSNYIINTTYKRALSAFKILQDKGLAQVFVIIDGYDSIKKLNELINEDDYLNYDNIMFATDTKVAGKSYGIRSWPHLYVISSDNIVIYETKIGSADKVQQILWRN